MNRKITCQFVAVPTELLEQLYKRKFNETERCIIDVILRATYGWSRASHQISIKYIANATGMDAHNVGRVLRELIKNRVVIQEMAQLGKKAKTLRINLQFEEYQGHDMRKNAIPPKKKTITGEKNTNTIIDKPKSAPLDFDFSKQNSE